MDKFLQMGIKARGLACELRNLLEEMDGLLREQNLGGFKDADCLEEALDAAGTVESDLDCAFPIECFPTVDSTTWRKDK